MPARVEIRLRQAERDRLERFRAAAQSRGTWCRLTAILMLGVGMTASEVASLLAVTVQSVGNWVRRWMRGRCGGLQEGHHPGRPPRVTRKYLRLLRESVQRGSRAYGYVFTVWSAARLSEHLRRRTKIRVTPKWVRELLRRMGYRFRRPKHTLRGRQNRRHVRVVRNRLKRLKAASLRRDAGYELWFEDEADFHLHPHLTRMWMRRGHQVKVPSPGQNRKQPAFGCTNYATGKQIVHLPTTKKGGKNSREFLVVVNRLISRAKRTGKKIVLVLDNGPIHRAHRVLKVIEDPALRKLLQVVWLPKYAPELNDQERVWKYAKEHGIANVLFTDKTHLRREVQRVFDRLNTSSSDMLMIVLGRSGQDQKLKRN